jgi:hypothetical protein
VKPKFLLIFGSAEPVEQNNKCDEAQQPQSSPNNPFCGVHLLRHRKQIELRADP